MAGAASTLSRRASLSSYVGHPHTREWWRLFGGGYTAAPSSPISRTAAGCCCRLRPESRFDDPDDFARVGGIDRDGRAIQYRRRNPLVIFLPGSPLCLHTFACAIGSREGAVVAWRLQTPGRIAGPFAGLQSVFLRVHAVLHKTASVAVDSE